MKQTATKRREMSRNAKSISVLAPLPDVGDAVMYDYFMQKAAKIEVLQSGSMQPLDAENRMVLTNYTYLIYEALELDKRRAVDYTPVRKVGRQYAYLLNEMFENMPVNETFKDWLKEDVDMSEMSMYAGTNRYNKNTHH